MAENPKETETKISMHPEDLDTMLAHFEARRRSIVKKMPLFVLGGLLLVGLLAYVFASQDPSVVIIAGIAAVVGGVLGYFAFHLFYVKGFTLDFKNQVVRAVIEGFDPTLSYEPNSGIAEHHFIASRLYNQDPDRYRCEDLICGQVGDTAFECSEVHAEYKTTTRDSEGRSKTQWHTIFKGQFFIADFHKHFHGQTIVQTDVAESMFGWLGQTLQEWTAGRGMELVKLEDPEFERAFVVYGTDQVEARYILTPSMMQRIMGLHASNQGVRIAFLGSEVYVALPTKRDLFEPTLYSPVDRPELIQEYLDDLQRLEDLVEELNLNTRIWTKE